MPTLKDYTEHLKQDKNNLRNYLATANIETNENDTFTELSRTAVNAAGVQYCVYAQPEEPLGKTGLWFKTNETTLTPSIEWTRYLRVNMTTSTEESLPLFKYGEGSFTYYNGFIYRLTTSSFAKYDVNNSFAETVLTSPYKLYGSLSSADGLSGIEEYNGKLYAAWGGMTPADMGLEDTTTSTGILEYDPESDTWTPLCMIPDFVFSSNRIPYTPKELIGVNNKLLIMSNCTGIGSSTARGENYFVYDFENKTLSEMKTLPMSRMYPNHIVVDDRYVYLFGTGYNWNRSRPWSIHINNTCYRMDITDETFSSLSNAPWEDRSFSYDKDMDCILRPLRMGNYVYFFASDKTYIYNIINDTYETVNLILNQWYLYPYFDEANSRAVLIYTGGGYNKTATYYVDMVENTEYPDGTVVLDGALPGQYHRVNFYYNSSIDTSYLNTYFKRAYLWDGSNNKPYEVECYLGDGAKWNKI